MPSGVEVQVLSRAPAIIVRYSGLFFFVLYFYHEQDN